MKKPSLSVALLSGVLGALLGGASIALAAEETVDLSAGKFTEDDLVGALGGGNEEAASRSIVASSAAPKAPSKVSLSQITFEKGSDRLTARAAEFLDVIGRALSNPRLKGRPFVIEGHTDLSGNADFNMRLSKRRAESVKRYLMEHHGVESALLVTVGKGPTDLFDRTNPQSERNRRVVLAPRSAP